MASAPLLEVAHKLRQQALQSLDEQPAQALPALQHALEIELLYGTSPPDVIKATSAVCKALRALSLPAPPAAAAPVLLRSIAALEQRDGGRATDSAELTFMWREAYGLCQQLVEPPTAATQCTFDALRAADALLEKLLQLVERGSLHLASQGAAAGVRLPKEELLAQQGRVAELIAQKSFELSETAVAGLESSDRDAAALWAKRAQQKLKLAGVSASFALEELTEKISQK